MTLEIYGDDRIRTGDLVVANHVLSQLSYVPVNDAVSSLRFPVSTALHQKLETLNQKPSRNGGPGLIRTADLVLIRDAL